MDLAGYRPTLSEVAALFGKSSRWISDLRAKGELPGDGGSLGEFVAAWTSLSAGSSGGKSIDQHKARLAAAKADQAEMKNAQTRSELLPRTLVTLAVQSAFARVRSKLLAMPSRCAPQIVSMKSAVAIEAKLTELVHEALAELAATTVGVEEAGADRGNRDAPGGEPGAGGDGDGLVAGDDTAAAADREPVGGREQDPKPGRRRRTG
jgi:hypothetical protein